MSSFADLGLSTAMQSNLKDLGYQQPTPIQAAALPPALAGRDLIATAKTGSGKTAAFGLPLIAGLNPRQFAVQGLVLCPTRELADQVAKALRQFARAKGNVKVLLLCGGVAIGPQIGSLAHGAHLVVGTPGRVEDHLRKGTLDLGQLKTLVLDEADRMLDMGFLESIESILKQTPPTRQTLLFSATWPEDIRGLSQRFQQEPEDVRVVDQESAPDIEEQFYEIAASQQADALAAVLSRHRPNGCIAFCTTRQQCDELTDELRARGFTAQALHGDLEQKERDLVLARFRNRSATILLATDVAARGLDIASLPLVVNVEPARNGDVHTHRIGRTGRAGEAGVAVTFCTSAQRGRLERLMDQRATALAWGDTAALLVVKDRPLPAAMRTLCIAAGRKQKVRPGDVLGALTGDAGLPGKSVGKIDVFEFQCLVAVEAELAKKALAALEKGRIKGRKIPVRLV
ncbi:ATP-dependent RNA helicase DbpA [Marinobacter xestospongiae]|uniref:ATP-dependent RNA helicase DbpA n=1 Tax=Marinobacter xestospongiae TaxID=994319 RepID=UPI002002DE6D|nr:ATP-dependent RNA helicase DbpA [Marinobacter xestospongiae]MCK7566844.1 ATP-dependent RNA helicase DbpA [Marinobacter xestospongiae]